jgi:arginine N-succinyltransferase
VFLLRAARASDLEAIAGLAEQLRSPNLIPAQWFLRERLARSERSFADPGPPCAEREYQFALEDADGRVVGTCVILSKHGTNAMPHFYLEVGVEERYSRSVGVRARHLTLRLRRSTDGPTEIGALVLHRSVRRARGSPGKLLSWGRFAFIATHRECFERELIAEMRAALDPAGRNLFWEAFGRRFTGLGYEEADRRSALEKSFIHELFPRAKIYASLLEPGVVDQLGRVHEESLPAVHLLERAGFHFLEQIDPFDAGPYYGARIEDVLPVRATEIRALAEEEPGEDTVRRIVSAGRAAAFRAVVAQVALEGSTVRLPKDARTRLGVGEGETVALTPLPEGGGREGSGRG